jgi:hypothetical protein
MEFRKIYLSISNPVCNRSGVKLSETTWKDHLVTCGIPYANTYGIPRNSGKFTAKNTAEFREIPRNSVCFSKNSVFRRKSKTHFRGHPTVLSAEQFGKLLVDFSGQFGTKIQSLRKNLVEGILPLETKLFLSVAARRVI